MNTQSIFCRVKTITTLLLLGVIFNSNRAQAQFATAAAYPFTASQKVFNYLVGGTAAPTANASSWDDTYTSPAIPIGFTFTFCNVPYTTVTGHTNGYMSFGNNTFVSLSSSAATLNNVGPCMMGGWHDAWGSTSLSAITYKTTGTAPNRVFTLEFKNWASFSLQTPYITYQYILYEGGPLELMYKQEGTGQFNTTAIGIGRNSTDYQSLPNTGASPTPSSTTFTSNLTAKPATGQSYLWGQIPCTGTPTTSAN